MILVEFFQKAIIIFESFQKAMIIVRWGLSTLRARSHSLGVDGNPVHSDEERRVLWYLRARKR